jgi:glutaredoxin
MQCSLCGHVRTLRDPLPDSRCPACGIAYTEGDRRVGLGLARTRPAQEPPAKSNGIGALLATLGFIVILFGGGWYLLRDGEPQPAPAVQKAQTVKGYIPAATQSQPHVVMYATSWCPYCARARTFFKRNGIRYTEFDVEKDASASARFHRFGGGVPIIVVDDQVVRGFNEAQLRKLLRPWLSEQGA